MVQHDTHLVALRRCTSYDVEKIMETVSDALGLIGFDFNSVSGKRVLLKPNMLGAYPPHKHVTTHPAFVEACARLFKKKGATVQVGDSSNGVYEVDEVWNVTGIRKACEFSSAEITPFERGTSIERGGLRIASAVIEADVIVNLPKLKTHGLTVLTGAVKNLYGCVPGMIKTSYHRELGGHWDFAGRVVEIANIVKPQLTIVDAITGMHGNGPSGGKLIDLGLIIAGKNIYAVDTIFCTLVGLDPTELETLVHAYERGVFSRKSNIDVVGESIDSCRPAGFELPETYIKKKLDWWISRRVLKLIWNNVKIQPVISADRCQRCGLCLKSCPVGAISWEGKQEGAAPFIDKKTCIQCFCCHEVCPYAAIDLKRSILVRMGRWLGRRRAR